MGAYGSGISFAKACQYDKERIKRALQGELMCGEDENGFLYAKASKEECDAYILSAYDNAVYEGLEAMRSGRAFERIGKDRNLIISLPEYINEKDEVTREESDKYIFEGEEDEER